MLRPPSAAAETSLDTLAAVDAWSWLTERLVSAHPSVVSQPPDPVRHALGHRAAGFDPTGAAWSSLWVYVVAHPLRAVSLGEAFSARLTRDGEDFGGEPARTDFSIAEGACLASTLLGESLTPAHYRLEYLAAEELIAAGEFDIAP